MTYSIIKYMCIHVFTDTYLPKGLIPLKLWDVYMTTCCLFLFFLEFVFCMVVDHCIWKSQQTQRQPFHLRLLDRWCALHGWYTFHARLWHRSMWLSRRFFQIALRIHPEDFAFPDEFCRSLVMGIWGIPANMLQVLGESFGTTVVKQVRKKQHTT